jgi:MYXO-CTERM domain-containing protein
MQRIFVPAVALCLMASCGVPNAMLDAVRSQKSRAMAFGTLDSSHTAVLSLLIGGGGGGSFAECSGSVVQVTNGTAYVLTAAHCCNQGAPQVVVMASDYSVGENALFGGGVSPPVFNVDQSSVFFDSAYNGQDHDFCMFKVPGVPANTPTLALPSSASDGVDIGVQVEHVGYGVTDQSQNNSQRRTGTDSITADDANTISYHQGGASQIPGPCEGDSGGPALIPAGAPQSQQTIVATTSFGLTQTCGADDTGTSSRVSSEIGPGGFITSFLADTPTGSQPGATGTDCNSCVQGAESQACASQSQACQNDAACTQLSQCLGSCSDQTCATNCESTAGQQAVTELNNFNNCACSSCSTQCASECGGTTGTCNVSTGNATCDTCINGQCCSQITACQADSSCTTCLGGGACDPNNAATTAIFNCLSSNCPCAVGEGEGEGEGGVAGEGEGEGAHGGEGEGEGQRNAEHTEPKAAPTCACVSSSSSAPWGIAPALALGLITLRRRRR